MAHLYTTGRGDHGALVLVVWSWWWLRQSQEKQRRPTQSWRFGRKRLSVNSPGSSTWNALPFVFVCVSPEQNQPHGLSGTSVLSVLGTRGDGLASRNDAVHDLPTAPAPCAVKSELAELVSTKPDTWARFQYIATLS